MGCPLTFLKFRRDEKTPGEQKLMPEAKAVLASTIEWPPNENGYKFRSKPGPKRPESAHLDQMEEG